ncbi:MAG: hypothetical protein IKU50_04305 [Bacteroidaceae bacterium]|nr:hypothetical protein [Bacteroidaceae bacterium]
MMCKDEIISQLNELAENVNYYTGIGWWHFKYKGYQMVYIPNNDSLNTIRICIPHFDSAMVYGQELLTTAINETNREVKYVKVVILNNGSISINYDHKFNEQNELQSILLHILKTLCFAAEHLKSKLSEK